jgi:integrase/recombinase XerC
MTGIVPQLAKASDADRSLVDRYILVRRGDGIADTTIRHSLYSIARWVIWLEQNGSGLTAARKPDAMTFIGEWTGYGWSPLTKRKCISDLRTFHEWLCEMELNPVNPWRGVKGPRKPRRLPRVLSEDEIAAMDRALYRPTVRDLRDRAFILFLKDSGCRVSEARLLDLTCVDLSRRTAIVTGKGGKERIVPFGSEAAKAIMTWINVGRPAWTDRTDGPVFIGRHGGPMPYDAARDSLIRARQRAGIGRHIHPHLLRHTMATTLYGRTRDIVAVKELLGHADISTTMIYTHMDESAMMNTYRQAMGDR